MAGGRSNGKRKAAKREAKREKQGRRGGSTRKDARKDSKSKRPKDKSRMVNKKASIPFISLKKDLLVKLRLVLKEYRDAKALADKLDVNQVDLLEDLEREMDKDKPPSKQFITGKIAAKNNVSNVSNLSKKGRIDYDDYDDGFDDEISEMSQPSEDYNSDDFTNAADGYSTPDTSDSFDPDASIHTSDFSESDSTSSFSDEEEYPRAKILDKYKSAVGQVQQLTHQLSKASLASTDSNAPPSPMFKKPHHIPLPPKTAAQLAAESVKLLENFNRTQQTPAYTRMQLQRQNLPAWELRDAIVAAHMKSRVLIVSGETGCGKTTQVPQFLLDAALSSGKGGEYGKIMVTQPRRISAIGVSDRVAKERGDVLGKEVGYQIRLESSMSEATRILYVTTGILLRRLEGAATAGEGAEGIDDFSTIIVDEVHERSLESDFLLMVLKDLLVSKPNLRVMLMSATLNAELFQTYFGGPAQAPLIHIPGRTFPVKVIYLEEALDKFKYRPIGEFGKKGPRHISKLPLEDQPDQELDLNQLCKRYPNTSRPSLQGLLDMNPEKIQYPLIEEICVWMVNKLLPGLAKVVGAPQKTTFAQQQRNPRAQPAQVGTTLTAGSEVIDQQPTRGILIFMPGYAEIQMLFTILNNNTRIRQATKQGKYIIALHGILSSEEQVKVFDRPPDGACKIVIATNVAETSITIDDVVYCIDTGRMKENRFDPAKNMASLEECWISQANGMQRRGRAGRVQPGTCVTLYTSHQFSHFAPQQEPEMKRTSLEQICLRIKVLPFLHGRIHEILGKVIEPPSPESVTAAIETLRSIQALTKHEHLTPLGWHLGRLPVDVRIGKLIIFGALFQCLDPILTIASTMSSKSPFYAPFDKREQADERKATFARGESDHMTLLRAYAQWQFHRSKGSDAERRFCQENFLSRQALEMIAGVKRQLAELLSDIGFAPPCKAKDMERAGGYKSDGVAEVLGEKMSYMGVENADLIKGVLISGLYPQVVRIEKTLFVGGGAPGSKKIREEYHMIVRDGSEVFVHPTSVNFKAAMLLATGGKIQPFPHPFLVYNEKVKTTKVYLRDCSNVSALAMAFFGGGRLKYDESQQILNMDDGWIRFKAAPAVALAIEAVRAALNEVLEMKISDPSLDLTGKGKGQALVDLIIEIINAKPEK
jgi:ATP-dependent RNA helicase DHX57